MIHFQGKDSGRRFLIPGLQSCGKQGVTSWVKNEPDGSATLEIQGTEEQIERAIDTVKGGPNIRVSEMCYDELSTTEGEFGFGVKW